MSHWDKHAEQWNNIGAPLRPSSPDIQIMCSWLHEIDCQSESFNVLLLGVTPELAQIRWPENTRLFAIDSNFSMIKSVLLKNNLSKSSLISMGNWLQLPLPESFINLVIGDGCYSMLSGKNYDTLSNEIVRVLHPTGHFFMRFFIRPDDNESIELIQDDFLSGRIDNFHILKWRIAMALHDALEQGVCLKEIWHIWNKHFKIHTKYLQWSEQTMNTIDVYKNNPAFYTFPTYPELSSRLYNQFRILDRYTPDYKLGERCPTLKLKPL